MKKVFIITTLLMALTLGSAAQQKNVPQQPQEQEELVDSTSKDAIEVYSDTTTIGSNGVTVTVDNGTPRKHTVHIGPFDLDNLSTNDIAGMLFVLAVLFIIFVLAPVLIIIALFYFINKNRKQRLQMAQMAMQNGQPIPDKLLEDKSLDANDEYQKGMRQCFVGVGLMVFLGYAAGQIGFGIGALVFCIGLGKVFAARTGQRKNDIPQDQSSKTPTKEWE